MNDVPHTAHTAPTDRPVPVIDLATLRDADLGVRRRLGKQIAAVCEDVGFFYIVNHGVSAARIARMFELGERFFALPQQDKLALSMANSRDYRGYLPMKMIGGDRQMTGNLLESFHVWHERAPEDADVLAGKPLHEPNVWPSALPALRDEAIAYAHTATQLASDMMRVIALGLDLPEDTFVRYFERPISLLRFIHYPPQPPVSDVERFGTRPHTDNGVFTLLAQDDTGGLEIMDREGEWVAVPPLAGSFVINLGEMMKVWSNGRFLATPHRVINRYGKERYSLPFFLNPGYDTIIAPILEKRAATAAPVFHTTVDPDANDTCGEILTRLYHRIWPSRDRQQTV
ncbi:isopenicillin N synthase family dioxygenase [Paraburkholderia sp. J41]|uniref:isopenicillin N synthase family dioxygenase n=1 Tax=Paraburkholderia sp. J41 TaxID=2805433 RepID=UPI002AC31F56|nr:2OG-Fe(II) oxygenase family protein [Paraburkholderia sp. J41]